MHLADDLFREEPGLAGNADQNVRLHVADHIQQRKYFVIGIPVFEILALLHQFGLERQQVWHGVGQQAETVDHKDTGTRQLFAEPFALGLGDDLLGNAAPGGTGAEEDDLLVAELVARGAAGRNQRADRYRGGALNIIIKGADFVAIAIQQRHGIFLGEIFKLKQYVRPAVFYRLDEIIHELIVLVVGDARVAPAHIERIVKQLLVVGADIQHHR